MFLINGQPRSTIESSDRGLHYGDGLFETLAVVKGRIPLWDRHLARLKRDSRRLGIPPPDTQQLREEADKLLDGSPRRCVLKIILTRGSGGQGYRVPEPASASRILQRRPWPEVIKRQRNQGIRIRFCRTPMAVGGPIAGIKHLNRLEQVVARSEWMDDSFDEGLMSDVEGHVVEGTMTNLFIQEQGRLCTPPVDRCGVAGVMRELVMELAGELEIEIEVGTLTRDRVIKSEGVFLTNAVAGILPVRALQDREFGPGDIQPELRACVHEILEGDG